MIPISHFLLFSAVLFGLGLIIVFTRKHILMVLMGIELMLNAVNINLAVFGHWDTKFQQGQIFALFVILVAAAEAGVALAIIIKLFKNFKTVDLSRISGLKD